MRRAPYRLRVDFSERHAALVDLLRRSEEFDVQMAHLEIGDYAIEESVVIERKTHADFVTSLVDGRLFPQAAALSRSPHRPVLLLEGPAPSRTADVHPNAVMGALVSLAVMWRLPVLHASTPEDSLRIVRDLAHQAARANAVVLRRYDRKPKRVASRKLHVLQGLPGIGPALAHRLLLQFGSVEKAVTASEAELTRVRGVGPAKAARIRAVVG